MALKILSSNSLPVWILATGITLSGCNIEPPAQDDPTFPVAKEFAQTNEIFVQDGSNLELLSSNPIPDCDGCMNHVFKYTHLGDPTVPYQLDINVINSVASYRK